jgi:hypothetical protein
VAAWWSFRVKARPRLKIIAICTTDFQCGRAIEVKFFIFLDLVFFCHSAFALFLVFYCHSAFALSFILFLYSCHSFLLLFSSFLYS